jgi:hypothetical protein
MKHEKVSKIFCNLLLNDNHNVTLPENKRQRRGSTENILAKKIILKPQSNSVGEAFCCITDNV